jgi:lysozyme
MSAILPSGRPRIERKAIEQMLHQAKVTDGVAIVGIRGYYRDSMGALGTNDRGLYDDALIVVSPAGFLAFNGNVDPSVYRPAIAVLQPGVWRYKIGIHGLSKPVAQRYKALVQAAPVTVLRDKGGVDTGMFGINIHRGGVNGTSSLGCQTIPPAQWPAFIALVESELKRAGQATVPYLLTAESRG